MESMPCVALCGRPVDFVTYDRNGILMVRANGIGISVGTKDYLHQLKFSGWLWKIPPSAAFPQGLICLWISIAVYARNTLCIAKGHRRYDCHPPKPTLLTVQLTHHDTRFILQALQMLEKNGSTSTSPAQTRRTG